MAKTGPKKGYKQSPEHILKRKRFGPEHHNWKGDTASDKAGRARAESLYPIIGPCSQCGNPKSERHHKDGNTLNNTAENIIILCRKCHMKTDGRLRKVREMAIKNQPRANKGAAQFHRSKTHCPHGHKYSGNNLIMEKYGARRCRTCRDEQRKARRMRG